MVFVNLLYFFIPGIVLLGAVTSYTDIREGKIRNKAIIFSLVYSLFIYLFLVFVLREPITLDYIIQTSFNVMSALFIGYLMWDVGIWTAGDGKLFLAYSALVPLFVYNRQSYIPFFSSLNILINTFVLFFLFFLVHLMISTKFSEKARSFKESFNLKKIFFLILMFFSFMWIIDIITGFIGIELNYFFYVIMYFFIISFFEKMVSKNFYLILFVISVLRLFLDGSVYSLDFLKTFLALILFFVFIRYFLLELSFNKFTKSLPIKKLKPGMIPAEIIYKNKEKGKYMKKKMLFFSFIGYLKEKRNKSVFDMASEGLTKENIDKIKKLAKKHPDLKTFKIQQTLPFAPFLFIGVILTLVASGNFFIFLRFIF